MAVAVVGVAVVDVAVVGIQWGSGRRRGAVPVGTAARERAVVGNCAGYTQGRSQQTWHTSPGSAPSSLMSPVRVCAYRHVFNSAPSYLLSLLLPSLPPIIHTSLPPSLPLSPPLPYLPSFLMLLPPSHTRF